MSTRLVMSALALLVLVVPFHTGAAQVRSPLVEKMPRIEHPDPRPDISAARVLVPQRFREGDVAQAYALAREIPAVLDGIYSYCHSGRSLLSCFESDWGARCSYCRTIVRRVYALHRAQRSLAYIRRWHVEPVPGVDSPAPRPAR